MSTVTDDTIAPGYDPGAVDLPWYRRALSQGAGYSAPSALFLLIPLYYTRDASPGMMALVVVSVLLIGFFFLGTSLVMHWAEWKRWMWILGLVGSILLLLPSIETTRPHYFVAYVTTTAAVLVRFRHAAVLIVAISVLGGGLSMLDGDLFGVVLVLMAFAIGMSLALGLERDRAMRRLKVAEERTAVLAVAAERERISRDLHDILGHSLTTIAVKSDLAERLVTRDPDGARAEIAALAAIARQALADVRATTSGMREVRLATEIASARSVLAAAGIEAVTPVALPVLGDTLSEVLGYAVREAVTNVVRHADASTCTIAFEDGALTITDDGVGLRNRGDGGSGLAGLRGRIEDVGGTLSMASAGGTTLRVRVPELMRVPS